MEPCAKCGYYSVYWPSGWHFDGSEGAICGECAAEVLDEKYTKALEVIQMFVDQYYVPGRENRPEIVAALKLLDKTN